MSNGYRLPARVQRQIWIDDHAHAEGNAEEFDAHDAMMSMSAFWFARVAREALKGGHDIDEVVFKSDGVLDGWLGTSEDRTFVATIEPEDFEEWLESVGLTREEACGMTEERLSALRERLASGPSVRP